jgi:hypothetical protein
VYALIVERLERHVLAERHVAAVMAAAGAKKVTVPTFETERGKLDRLLGEGPERRQRDPEQAALIAALGLGG